MLHSQVFTYVKFSYAYQFTYQISAWIFEISIFNRLQSEQSRGWNCITMPNFVEIGPNAADILRFIDFCKMAAAAILDFKNFKFVTVGTVKNVELHQFAKFHRNRWHRGRDMWIPILVWLENAYLRPFLGFYGGTFSPNDVTHRSNLQKDHPWAEPRHLIAIVGLSYRVTEI